MLIKMNENFGGIMPAVDERKLPYNAAQTAQDVNLDGGTLAPYKGRTSVETGIGASQRSLYHYHRPLYTLTCGTNGGNIAAYQAVTNGSLVIGDDQFLITGLDFSGASDFDDVAALIQTAMRDYDIGNMVASTCVFDTDHFVFTYNERIPYLETGYSAEIDCASYGSNTATASASTPDNAWDGSNSTACSLSNLANELWIKKDFGASSSVKLTEVVSLSQDTWGYLFDAGAAPDIDASGYTDMKVEVSADDTNWITIANTTIRDAAGLTTTMPIDTDTFYRYVRITIVGTYDTTPAGFGLQIADITLTGHTYTGVTNISDSSYLNGESGTGAMVETDDAEWLTWSEEDISVVRSPVVEDRYSRIYWTGEDGELKTRGTFGTRTVNIEKPEPPSIVFTDVYVEAFTGRSQVIYDVGAGPAELNTAMTLVSIEKTDVGYSVKYNMAEIVQASGTAPPTIQFQLTATGVLGGAWIDTDNIGIKYAQIDDSTVYAEFALTSVIGETTSDNDAGTYTWTEREVTFIIDMNYRLQTNTTQYYLCTYVDDLGQESEISIINGGVVRDAEDRATITLPTTDTSTIKKVRLYRSANSSANNTTGWFFVTEEDEGTATYIDWNRDEDLTEGLILYDNPVSDMDGLVVMPGMFGLAFKDQTLYVSEQELLYSWNPGYELNYDANIVALAITGNECYIVTEDQLYIVTGDTPDQLTSAKINVNQSGLNWRGVATVASRVLYPSPDGYVAAVNGEAKVITEEYIQARDWSDYNPSTIVAEQYNNKLYACSGNTFFVMDFDEGLKAISTLSYASTVLGLHYDSIDDKLYCIIGTGIWSIDTNATTYDSSIWRSKEFEELRPWRPSCVRVYADDYTTSPTLKIYAEGSLVHTATITDDKGLKIPQLRKEKRWFFEIESKHEILDVELADSIGNLK